jgi:MTH538 TIR-like domain (DUF1863)
VRNSNVVVGPDVAGFFDHSEYEEAKKQGAEAIRRMILRHLQNTTVTAVLIGTYTAYRPWVQYEIQQSIERQNGLVGIYIHHLRDQNGRTSLPGPIPSVPANVVFPVYAWDANAARFRLQIEAAGKRAEEMRARSQALKRLFGIRRL